MNIHPTNEPRISAIQDFLALPDADAVVNTVIAMAWKDPQGFVRLLEQIKETLDQEQAALAAKNDLSAYLAKQPTPRPQPTPKPAAPKSASPNGIGLSPDAFEAISDVKF